MFQGLVVIHSLPAPQQCPAPGIIHAADKRAASTSTAALLALARRGDQRTQAGEAVGVHQASANQFLQGDFQFGAQQVRFMNQLIEKQRAVLTQGFKNLLGFRDSSLTGVCSASALHSPT